MERKQKNLHQQHCIGILPQLSRFCFCKTLQEESGEVELKGKVNRIALHGVAIYDVAVLMQTEA